MALPDLPPRIYDALRKAGLDSFYSWFQEQFKAFINTKFNTVGDVTLITKGKGVVLTNAAGTVTKRVRLNDAGNGLIYEDV